MAKKPLPDLLDAYQGNAWPAMLESLGENLDISAESMARLGIGFAPIVYFKAKPTNPTGANYQGWWVGPERDADGNVIGLALRSRSSNFKAMFPGSKHGLCYEINPNHRHGQEAYQKGKHNWARVVAAGVDCPVCGKMDGCLVSSEDPQDPKAVVCIRTPSDRRQSLGFLHILKDAGQLDPTATLLPPSDLPVLVVEGWTDTAVAMDMGFVAVGRPSNLACMDMLADLVRGRSVIIVGENDDINPATGKRPGEEGMVAAYQILKTKCRDIEMVLPPDEFKDLRKWHTAQQITSDQFMEYVGEHKRESNEQLVFADDDPRTLAQGFLHTRHRMAGRHITRFWNGGWWTYTDGCYRPVTDLEFTAPMYDWAADKKVMKVSFKGESRVERVRCDNSFVSNTCNAARAATLINEEVIPCWINGMKGPDPEELIAFSNGILHIPTYLDGQPFESYMMDPTPDLFTTSAIPYAFDPTAPYDDHLSFLESSLGDEPSKIAQWQEWLGYCLTTDTSHQKMMFLRGPSGAGKSVCINLLAAMVGGKKQTASPKLADLATSFGLAPLLGKSLCIIPDARVSRGMDAMRGLEVLLNIAADDYVDVNRKNRDVVESIKLGCHVTIGSNEFLEVPDHAGAMQRRMLITEFKRSFRSNPDKSLERRLTKNIAGLAVFALEGLRRLRAKDDFTEPESSKQALLEWAIATSPIASMLEECTRVDESGSVQKSELYDVWAGWSSERRITAMSKTKFFERLHSNAPYITSDTTVTGGHKLSVFKGLSVQPWAAKQYLGKL